MQRHNLGVEDKHTHPRHFRVKSFLLYPHNVEFSPPSKSPDAGPAESSTNPLNAEGNKAADIFSIVDSFSFSEGLHQPALFGEAIIADSIGMLENYRVSGGEKVEIIIIQDLPEELKEIKLEFYIAGINNFSKINIGTQSYKIQLATKEHFKNSLLRINKDFNDVPTKLIQDIMSDIGVDEINIEGGGSTSMKGIYPKLRPFDAISWILRNSQDTQTPMFFYEDHNDGHQLKSYKSILDQMNSVGAAVKEKMTGKDSGVYSEYSNNPYGLEKTNEDPNYYEINRRRILDFQIVDFSNKLRLARKGAYGSRARYVDIAKKYYSPPISFTYKENNLLNENKPFCSEGDSVGINKFDDSDYKNAREYFINYNSSLFGAENSYHTASKDNILQTVSSYENLFEMKATLTLNGDPGLVPGSIINLKMFKDQPEELAEDDDNIQNAHLSGNYLVETITHSFAGDGYYMGVTALKDSYKLDFDEKVKL